MKIAIQSLMLLTLIAALLIQVVRLQVRCMQREMTFNTLRSSLSQPKTNIPQTKLRIHLYEAALEADSVESILIPARARHQALHDARAAGEIDSDHE